MEITISYKFKSEAEAKAFLSGKEKSETTSVQEEAPATLEDMTVAQLKEHAKASGVVLAPGLRKKSDIIDCINGNGVAQTPVAPVQEAAPVAPVQEAAPVAPVQAAPVAVDRNGILEDIKAKYADAQAVGITNDVLNNTIGTHLQRIGSAGVKLSELDDNKLVDFHSGFTTQVASFINHANQQAPASSGAQGFM